MSGDEEESNDEPSSEEESDDEPSSDEDDDEHMPPPPPPKNTSPPVVTHIRHYSKEYKNHYYTQVDDPDGESDWVPPTAGIVQCTDEDDSDDTSGRIFYTQSSTGKTAWNLNDF